MWEELKISQDDAIAVIASHPDDECLGASFGPVKITIGQICRMLHEG